MIITILKMCLFKNTIYRLSQENLKITLRQNNNLTRLIFICYVAYMSHI